MKQTHNPDQERKRREEDERKRENENEEEIRQGLVDDSPVQLFSVRLQVKFTVKIACSLAVNHSWSSLCSWPLISRCFLFIFFFFYLIILIMTKFRSRGKVRDLRCWHRFVFPFFILDYLDDGEFGTRKKGRLLS